MTEPPRAATADGSPGVPAGLAIVCAAPAEAEAARAAGFEARLVGVGKTAAALGTAELLARGGIAAVVSCGVCGAFGDEPAPASLCVVRAASLVDEGVAVAPESDPEGRAFLDGARDLGFETAAGPWAADERLLASFPAAWPRVHAATVSTCSGTDALARAYAARSGCEIETMESAAIAAACARAGVPWADLRAVSNRCGDRERAGWDLRSALAALRDGLRDWRAGGAIATIGAGVERPGGEGAGRPRRGTS